MVTNSIAQTTHSAMATNSIAQTTYFEFRSIAGLSPLQLDTDITTSKHTAMNNNT